MCRHSKLCSTEGMSSVVRPDWWCYPLHCPAGHPWAPGRVTVGWMPCDCPNTVASNVLGHLWVRCRAEGCPSIWYRPRHQPEEQALAEAGSVVSWPGAWRPVAVGYDVNEAKTHFSQLLDRAAAGEEIVIARAGRPVARLVALAGTANRRRKPGAWRGKVTMTADFD